MLKRISILLISIYCSANLAKAEDFGIIEQTIAVGFKPASTYALVTQKPTGRNKQLVRRIHGSIIPSDNNSVHVAILVPNNIFNEEEQEIYYCFFLLSTDGEIAATEVKTTSKEQILNSFISKAKLLEEIKQYEEQLPVLKTKNVLSQTKLSQTKEKASKIAEVDDLVDLKSELENLKSGDSNAMFVMLFLKNLYAKNAFFQDTPEDMQMRMELDAQLREILKASLLNKKAESNSPADIIANFHKKIELVKSTENSNAELLAIEVLRLRKQRKELEAQLNTETTSKDF